MTRTYTKKERIDFSDMALEQVVDLIGKTDLLMIGRNSRLLLNELGLRLNVPFDAMGLVVFRQKKAEKYEYRLWSIFSEERKFALRELPERRWNNTCKCNTFFTKSENDPATFNFLKRFFAKIVVINEHGFHIETGSGIAEWCGGTIYSLTSEAALLKMNDVLQGFYQLRPNDHPKNIVLHGEFDEKYRTLFDETLVASADALEDIKFTTRHQKLIFRLSLANSKPRYLVYSVLKNEPLEVLFADSKDCSLRLSQFKETQQRLGIPLVDSVIDVMAAPP